MIVDQLYEILDDFVTSITADLTSYLVSTAQLKYWQFATSWQEQIFF